MTAAEYQKALEAKLKEGSTPENELGVQEAAPGANAWTLTINKDCSLVIGPPEDVRMVMVICGITPSGAANGLCAACCALDALDLGSRDWRNGVLERLHLYDGKFSNGLRHATQARGWELAVQVNHPGKGLMSYTYRKL